MHQQALARFINHHLAINHEHCEQQTLYGELQTHHFSMEALPPTFQDGDGGSLTRVARSLPVHWMRWNPTLLLDIASVGFDNLT